MNASSYSDTFSFTFDTINRGVSIFPKLKKMSGVKTFCEMIFMHPDAHGSLSEHTIGVVRARLVPGMGAYTVFDLISRPKEWGKICQTYSRTEQRPVYHKKEETKCSWHQVLVNTESN